MSYGSAPAHPATSQTRFLAHVRQAADGSFVIHDLEEHLRSVAQRASEFTSTFGHSKRAVWIERVEE